MFERFVVAYDGSDSAAPAVEFAFALAAGRGAQVTLAYVIEAAEALPDEPAAGIDRLIELAEEEWAGRLAGLAADAPDEATVDTEVLVASRAAPALLDLAADRNADVLVAGTHGVGILKRVALGSVSHQLLEHAPCSVLLVPDRPEPEGPPVVVAGVDGSQATPGVVAIAERAAAVLSAQLVLAHGVEPWVGPGLASITTNDALRSWAREQGQRILHEAHARVASPLETVVEELREGRPSRELVGLCEERRPVLAVVGSRGLHGFKGLLLGSTARYVVNHAPCPVLVVRTPPVDGPAPARP